MTGFKA